MKTLKILLLVLILLTWTNVYSNETLYNTQNLTLVKSKLIETTKWKDYYNKFNVILVRYSTNEEILLRLQNRIIELKTIIQKDENKYSNDIMNLISYMDQVVYFYLDKLWINAVEDKVIINEEEQDMVIDYPGFSDDYLDEDKNIVAGSDYIIFSWKISSKYESVDVWSIKFYIEWLDASYLKNSIDSAYLYLEWAYIAKAMLKDIDIISSTKATITFDNMDNFIVPQKEVAFRLWIKANSIWYEKIGKTLKDLAITKVSLYDAVWLNSWNNINAFTTDISVESFSIVPWIPVVSVVNNLSTSTVVKINIKWEFWSNTIDSSNAAPSINLNKIRLTAHDNSDTTIYKLLNSDDSSDYVIWIRNWSLLEFDLSIMNSKNKTISNWKWEDYEIRISNTTMWVTLEMPKDGIEYDVLGVDWAINLNINMKNSINLWYRDF